MSSDTTEGKGIRMSKGEDIPGIDPALVERNEAEFGAAVKALDSKSQRVVGQLLAGARTTEVAERLRDGDVEVLSTGILTTTKRSNGESDMANAGGAMRAALQLAGVTSSELANTLRAGMRANKAVFVGGKRKTLPDWAVRLRYLELAHRLRGDLTKDAGAGAGADTYEERLRMVMKRRSSIREGDSDGPAVIDVTPADDA